MKHICFNSQYLIAFVYKFLIFVNEGEYLIKSR